MTTNYQEYYSLDVPCFEDQTHMMDKKGASQVEINHLVVSLIYCQDFKSQMPACRELNPAPARGDKLAISALRKGRMCIYRRIAGIIHRSDLKR